MLLLIGEGPSENTYFTCNFQQFLHTIVSAYSLNDPVFTCKWTGLYMDHSDTPSPPPPPPWLKATGAIGCLALRVPLRKGLYCSHECCVLALDHVVVCPMKSSPIYLFYKRSTPCSAARYSIQPVLQVRHALSCVVTCMK